MTLEYAILIAVVLVILAVTLPLLIRRASAEKGDKGRHTPPLSPLEPRITKNAELLLALESRMKAIEGEWEVYYAKMRTLAGKAYREQQVADGKHKGAAEGEAARPAVDPHAWKAQMAARKHGLR